MNDEQSKKQALIIFVRRPERGKVKTRIAATAGDILALDIYRKLLAHTNAVSAQADADRFIFYADAIGSNDLWNGCRKQLQDPVDLGLRMYSAFRQVFGEGYAKVCIIGSDCAELEVKHLREAFAALRQHDMVIGPATDGGYYLLGLRTLREALFANIAWSTDAVLAQTLERCSATGLSHTLLATLSDVDTWEAVPEAWKQALPGAGTSEKA